MGNMGGFRKGGVLERTCYRIGGLSDLGRIQGKLGLALDEILSGRGVNSMIVILSLS